MELVKCRTIDLHSRTRRSSWRLWSPERRQAPDHTGFYSLADDYPAFTTAITHQRDPIYLTTVVGAPHGRWLMGKATERASFSR